MLGYLYADIDGAFGRFRDTDRDLLGMLAAQAAVALDNVRFAAKLEQKVAKRTAQLEQRANELTLINSIQQGVAAELNFQTIIDLVGDKLREIYDQKDLGIRIYDPESNLVHFPYTYENRERIHIESQPLPENGFGPHVLRTRETLVINENIAHGIREVRQLHHPRYAAHQVGSSSCRWWRATRHAALINLMDLEREHAYSASDVRLLETLAASMSVALDNARLFDEVQKSNAQISEALERETASNDILRVIAESPTDVRPVLDVIAQPRGAAFGLGRRGHRPPGRRKTYRRRASRRHPDDPDRTGNRLQPRISGRPRDDRRPALAGDPRYGGH